MDVVHVQRRIRDRHADGVHRLAVIPDEGGNQWHSARPSAGPTGHQLAQRAISGALLFTYSTSRSSSRRIRLSSIEKEVNWPGRL